MSLDPRTDSPPPGGEHPDRIGPYRLVRELGAGGMGVVYLAEQTEPVRREVALKVLKPGMDTRQVVARFEAERQALAVMEHPGIARVFDAGATAAGRPYFVMERVEGVAITEYCDAQRLGVRDRVRLLGQVCRAVQHAHQKGVIHRDLKPSNVLVTVTDGAPLCKIIDFGIARAVERTAEEQTLLTRADQSLGTPAYMSPEQVDPAGRDIDTRSDIYSLGVLLYELLAGALPFEPAAYRGWAFYAQHLVREPSPPSVRIAGLEAELQSRVAAQRRTDPAALRRQLRGELDWVVMRALEKERERRYETANGFAFDLDRYLANEPVLASPPSRAYRARKFVRRHRAGVAFAAVVAVLLVGFAGAMGVQAERVARARDLAVARQGQAEDLIGFMVGDLRGKLTPVGRLDILDDVGQRALAYFAAVPESELTDEELFRRAEAIRQLGEVRLDQGDLDAAMETFREALGLTTGLAARDPRNGQWQVGLGAAHFWVGDVLRRQGDLEGAQREYSAYRDVAARLVERDPRNLEWRRELVLASSNLGVVAYTAGDLPAALGAWTQRLDAQRLLSAQAPSDLDLQFELSNAHNQLGVALEESGDLAGALANLRTDVGLKRALLAQDPQNTQRRGFLAVSLSYLAGLSNALGMPDSAVAQHVEELRINTELAAHDPANAVWQRRLAITNGRLGSLLLDRGDVAGAAPLVRQGASIASALRSANPADVGTRTLAAQRYRDLANLALAQRDTRRALSITSDMLALLDSVIAERPGHAGARRTKALVLLTRGDAWAAAGNADAARADWSRAADLLEPLAAQSREWLLLDPWARALLRVGRDADADRAVERLREIGYAETTFVRLVDERRGPYARTR
jgi:eukaryotic-like serine/threonine-protein kinase